MIDVFEYVKLIPLETNGKSIIGNMKKFIIYDSKIFILDKSDYSILNFDINGNFLSKLSRKGKGPEEYLMIEDFDINYYSKTVDIMTCTGEVYSYDFDGVYHGMYSLPDVRAVHHFSNLTEDLVAFYTDLQGKKLRLYSKKNKKVLYNTRFHPKYSISIANSPFHVFNNEVYLNEAFGAYIYKINSNGLEKYKYIDYCGYSLEPEEIETYGSERLFKEFTTHVLGKIHNLWTEESNHYFIHSVLYKNKEFTYIYSKNDSSKRLINTFNNGCSFFYNPCLSDDILYSIVPANYLNIYLNKDACEIFDITDTNTSNEYSNPFLIIAKLK
jgi:hypothetical protein